MKTKLTKSLSASEFQTLYFTVSELRIFCRQVGIATASGDRKKELTQRVFNFLNIGQLDSKISLASKADSINKSERLFFDQQKIGRGFKFSWAAREYFERTLDPSFKCNVSLLKWVKENPQALISDLKTEYLRIKASKNTTIIGKQFELNQFTRDFFAANPNLSRKDCLTCWKKVRELRDRKYSDQHLAFLTDSDE